MITTVERLQELLLDGRRVNKFTFLHETGSVCLAQRILDIRQTLGWNIRSRAIKGKGALREYWLDPEEIQRIKSADRNKPILEQKVTDEQLVEDNKNLAEKASESLKNEEKAYFDEQLSLGLFGER